MAISKTLFSSFLICLVTLHFVESDTTMIVMLLAMEGANYHRGQIYVIERVAVVVSDAIVCLRVLLVTMRNVYATLISLLTVEGTNALKLHLYMSSSTGVWFIFDTRKSSWVALTSLLWSPLRSPKHISTKAFGQCNIIVKVEEDILL